MATCSCAKSSSIIGEFIFSLKNFAVLNRYCATSGGCLGAQNVQKPMGSKILSCSGA